MKKLILYIFLVVITDPYKYIDYDKVNVYDVNYCAGRYCEDGVVIYDYVDDEEEDFYNDREEETYIFPVDFLNK